MLKPLRANFTPIVLSAFWLLALLNPVFKKYDYGAEFPMVVVFGVLLLCFAIFELGRKRERAWIEKGSLLAFMAFVVVSFVFSQYQSSGFSEVLAFSGAGALYLLLAYREIPWIQGFLRVVRWGAILAVLVGFYIYIFRAEPRMIGPFFNILYHAHVWPNAFALFLLMVWPIFLVRGKFKPDVFLQIAALGMVMSAIMLSFSRGALIVLVGQLILLGIYNWRRIGTGLVVAVMVFFVAFGLFYSANYLRALNHDVISVEDRATFGGGEELTSKRERIDFWLGAIELIKKEPVFGFGPFAFRHAYNGIQTTFLANADHPHNIFLKIGAENGLPALAAFAIFLLAGFATVARRFASLTREKKDLVFLLGLSVVGAFAHSLIDYNFNFLANLLLLFVFMAFMRSLVVKKAAVKAGLERVILPLVIAVFSFYEGGLLVLAHTVDESYMEYSLYPRNYYLDSAQEVLTAGDAPAALEYLEEELERSPLDAQANYLEGVAYCATGETELCRDNFAEALELNPMNDFNYYLDYLRMNRDEEVMAEAAKLLENYFNYVDMNVHFTAYTSNVEAAGRLIDFLIGVSYEYWPLAERKNWMLERAAELRAGKTF